MYILILFALLPILICPPIGIPLVALLGLYIAIRWWFGLVSWPVKPKLEGLTPRKATNRMLKYEQEWKDYPARLTTGLVLAAGVVVPIIAFFWYFGSR